MNRWKRRLLSLCILSLIYALAAWLLQETAGRKYRFQVEQRKDYAEILAFLKEHNVKPREISLATKKTFGFPAWCLTEFVVLGFILGSFMGLDALVGMALRRREKQGPEVDPHRG